MLRFSRTIEVNHQGEGEEVSVEQHQAWHEKICRSLLASDPELRELSLDGSSLQPEVFTKISDSLRVNRKLHRLELRNLNVALSTHVLAPAVKNSQVQVLVFENTNDPDGQLAAALSVALFYNRRIHTLHVRDCLMHPSSSALGFLVQTSALTELRLCHNEPHMSPDMAFALSQGLKHNTILRILDLTGCGMDDETVCQLSKGLQCCTSRLEFLSLDFNAFGDAGVASLASMLTVNRHLTELHLFGNRVTAVGAEHLGLALPRNESLHSLILSFNQIGDRGAVALARALTENATLTNLWFPSNSIGHEGMEAFARYLPKMNGLEQLNVGLLLDCKAEEALTMGLKNNLSLSVLHMEKPVYGSGEEEDEEEEDNTDMNFYLRLNRSGRRLLRKSGVSGDRAASSPPGLWAIILERTSEHAREVRGKTIPDVLYYLLREIPEMLEPIAATTTLNHIKTSKTC